MGGNLTIMKHTLIIVTAEFLRSGPLKTTMLQCKIFFKGIRKT